MRKFKKFKRKRRISKIEPIDNVINNLLYSNKNVGIFRELPRKLTAMKLYNSIEYRNINKYSQAVNVIKNDLWVNVSNSLVANEISLLQDKIIRHINKKLRGKYIRKIFFKIEDIVDKQNEDVNPIASIKLSLSEVKNILRIIRSQNVKDRKLKRQLFNLFASSLKSEKRSNENNE